MSTRHAALRFLVAAAAFLPLSAAQAEETGRLPADWYVLPEDAKSYYSDNKVMDVEEKDGTTYKRGEEAVAESVDKIFYYTAQSLDKSGDIFGSKTKPANAPLDWAPWHLSEILMELGVNAAGTAGLVTGIGEASVEVRWAQVASYLQKHGVYKKAVKEDDQEAHADSKSDLTLNEYTTYAEMERMVDTVTDAVMATGRVDNRGPIRDGLLKTAVDLQAMMVNINSYNDSYWDISKFGLDVSISASGKVSAGWTLGGAIRLRFEWKRASYGEPTVDPNDGQADKREQMRKLLAGMAKDMETVSSDLYAGSGFELKQMRLGIGMYFGANIFGVVKGKLGFMGYAYFAKSGYRANANYVRYGGPRIIPTPGPEIPLLSDEVKAPHLAYANENGIRYDRIPGGDGAEDRVIYYMQREKFQKGIQRATQMGAFFAKRAYKKNGGAAGPGDKRWLIDQLKPTFALSLEGAAKLVTIGGSVSLELTFKAI